MNISDLISSSIMRIRMRAPFFGTLILFADIEQTDEVVTAATDGKRISFNPDFVAQLKPRELDGLVLHEVLHAALLHNQRRGQREPYLWNIAADIAVNKIVLSQSKMKLPGNPIIDEHLAQYQVEEIYQILLRSQQKITPDPTLGQDLLILGEARSEITPLGEREQYDSQKEHWELAWRQANTLHQMTSRSDLPAELTRMIKEVTAPKLDWKTILWRFLVQTPTDFGDWDRRFIHQGMYLESLNGKSLKAHVAIDTSASIDDDIINEFIAELHGILSSYPHVDLKLYYADAKVHGPYRLHQGDVLPKPRGGGGTSFKPFFNALHDDLENEESVNIYLTDGYGHFPEKAPKAATLWVVTPKGLTDNHFPFGQVIRIH